MDLSKLSDSDLLALKSGDLSRVSDSGLMHLKEQEKKAKLDAVMAEDRAKYDPTIGMSGVGKFVAGVGQGAAKLGRAVGQGVGLYSDEEIKDANRLDSPLLKTGAGATGSVVGQIATLAPTAFIPGANTYTGAALIGAGTGLATTEGGLGDRAKGAALGAAGGVVAKGIGDKVGSWLRGRAQKDVVDVANRQAQNAERDAVLSASRDAGYVVPPSNVEGSSTMLRIGEGLGGKLKTEQAASIKNQRITDDLARKSLGLAEDVPLTKDTLKTLRDTAFTKGYEPVRNAGTVEVDQAFLKKLDDLTQQLGGASKSFPGAVKNDVAQALEGLKVKEFDAGDAVDMIRTLRDSASGSYRSGNNALAKAQRGAADALEAQIERGLQSRGKDGVQMLKDFRDARQLMAKAHTVEKALNDSTSSVNAGSLARELGKGKPLSEELLTAAQFAQAFPKSAQAVKSLAPYSLFDLGAAGIGGASANPGLVAAVAARPAVRNALLSSAGQRLAKPSYSTNSLLQGLSKDSSLKTANVLLRASPLVSIPTE